MAEEAICVGRGAVRVTTRRARDYRGIYDISTFKFII